MNWPFHQWTVVLALGLGFWSVETWARNETVGAARDALFPPGSRQLELTALGHVLATLLGAAPRPARALNLIVNHHTGTWLAYLMNMAARAGYPAFDRPSLPRETREALAGTGLGFGFADQLRRESRDLSGVAAPELSRNAAAAADRLERKHATAEAMSRSHVMKEGGK